MGAADGSDLLGESLEGGGGGEEGLGINFVIRIQPMAMPIVMVYRNPVSTPEEIITIKYCSTIIMILNLF